MTREFLILLLLGATPSDGEGDRGTRPTPLSVCTRDSECPRATFCACGIRLDCRFLMPDSGQAKCLTFEQSVQVGAALLRPGGSIPCGDGGWCHTYVPPCKTDRECPQNQRCSCDSPDCSFRTTFQGFSNPNEPPFSTFGCVPPDIDSGYVQRKQ